MTVGKSFVATVLREHRYAVADLRRCHKHRVPASLPTNAVWAIDMTGKGDTKGRIHVILGILDHGARKLLRLDKLVRRTSWTLLGHLCLAIAAHGKPAALRTDNEACLTSRTFRAALALMRIRHERTAPGCPWQNGRIERAFGTLKHKLDLVQIADARELGTLLASFRFWYNAIRPHQHLGGRTPDETWHGIDPYARPPREVRWFSAWDGMLAGFEFRR